MIRILKVNKVINFLLLVVIISGFIGKGITFFELKGVDVTLYRILICILIYFVVLSLFLRIELNNIFKYGYNIFFICWILYAVVQLLWTIDLSLAFRDLSYLFVGILIILLPQIFIRNNAIINNLYYLWLVSVTVFTVLGLLNILTGVQLPSSKYFTGSNNLNYLPTAVFYNTNDYATFIALVIPLAISYAQYNKSLIKKIFGFILTVLNIFILVETHSRANYVAFLLWLCFWVIFIVGRKFKLFIIFSIILLGFVLLVSNGLIELNSVFGELRSLNIRNNSINIRIHIVYNSLEYLKNTFGFGVGPGNIEYFLEHYQYFDINGVFSPHNWWIELPTNYGIFIFFGYITTYIYFYKKLFSIFKENELNEDKRISSFLLGSLVAFPIASLSPSGMIGKNYHWLLLSFIALYITSKKISNEEKLMKEGDIFLERDCLCK